MQRALPITVFLFTAMTAPTANAFVSSPTGGRPGQVDVRAAAVLERGKVEPHTREVSFRPASWEMYELSATYNVGDLGGFQGFYVRASGTFVDTPDEVATLTTPGATCLGTQRGDGRCEFYADDEGGIARLATGIDLIHDPRYSIGVFLQASLPLGLDLDKFVTTRVDFLAGGLNVGVRLAPWLTHTTQLYLGTGALGPQNATVAWTQMLNPEVELGLPVIVHVGTYFDGDLTERFDERYDAAYTLGVPGERDPIRMMRFGVLAGVTVGITERVSVDVVYLQKLFGFDTPATQFFTVAAQVSL